MITFFRLFFISARLKTAKAMAYRADFISGTIAGLAFSMVGPIAQLLIFSGSGGYPGWNIDQVLLFQSILMLVVGIRGLLFADVESGILRLVWWGELDGLMLKPYSTAGVLLSQGFNINNAAGAVSGLILTVIFSLRCSVHITLTSALLIILSLIFAMIFYGAFLLFCSGLSIIFVKFWRVFQISEAALRFSEYPVQILPPAIRVIFVVFFPVSIFAYFPSQILLSRLEGYAPLGFLFSVIVFYGAYRFFYFAIKKYTSAGG